MRSDALGRLALIAATAAMGAGVLAVGSLLTREEALALAYPGATFASERVFLTAEQQKQAAARAGGPIASALIARYIASKDGKVVGRAYVDTHTVRTKKETLVISLDGSGALKRVDVTAFLEPAEYQAPQAFLNQYAGRALTDDLRLQRAIRPVAGATLTAHAITDAVRRVLAIDAVLR
jgi:hypothetical protein